MSNSNSSRKQTNGQSKCCPNPLALFRACCLALPVLHPYGLIRLCWDTFIMICLIYTAIEIPLSIAFDMGLALTNTLGIIAFSIDIILLADIALNFRTGYYDKWDRLLLHTDPFDIAKKYFKFWFWLDLATSFPLEFIVASHGSKSNEFATYIKVLRIFRLLRIFKILRVIRVMKMFDGLTDMLVTREIHFVIRLLKIMGAMVLTAHYFACIWWYVGVAGYEQDIPDSSWLQAQGILRDDPLIVKYSYSWYWAIVTLFTTGYGDITAHNTTEQWVCSICILTGSCFFAYFVGTLTTWISEGDRVRGFEIQKVEEAQAFCRHHKFDRELTRTVLTHVRYYCNYNYVFDSEDILPLLPPFLQRELNEKIAVKYLSELDIFKDLPKEIIGQIALTMQSISCNAGRYLYKRGDIATCMYLQRTGEAKLRYLDGTPSRRLKRGDVVGERAIISGKRRYDVVCTIWTEFFALNIRAIQMIFRNKFKPKRYEYEWNKIREIVRRSGTKDIKIQRKCNLAHTHEERRKHISRQVVHELSLQGSSLRSELLERIAFPNKKNLNDAKYTKICTNDDDDDEFKGINGLDIDDANSLSPKLDITEPIIHKLESIEDVTERKEEEMIRKQGRNARMSRQFMLQHSKRLKTVPISRGNNAVSKMNNYKSASSLICKIAPFVTRHNSEERNKKVISDTVTTAYGKKTVRAQPTIRDKLMSFSMDFSASEELDLDVLTADVIDQDIVSPGKPRMNGGRRGTKKPGKFGGRTRKNVATKKERQKAVSGEFLLSNVLNKGNNKMRKQENFQDVEYIESDEDIQEEEDNYMNDRDVKSQRELIDDNKKMVELGKITNTVTKLGFYAKTGSKSGDSMDDELKTVILIQKQPTDFQQNVNMDTDETNINIT